MKHLLSLVFCFVTLDILSQETFESQIDQAIHHFDNYEDSLALIHMRASEEALLNTPNPDTLVTKANDLLFT